MVVSMAVSMTMTVPVSMAMPVSMIKGRTVWVLVRKISKVAEAVEAGVGHPNQSEQAA